MSSETSGVTACLPPFSQKEQRFLLEDLLRDVSRSFYLTLRVLPAQIRPQISLAYLLARASDTIADTKAVAKEERVQQLRDLAKAILACGNDVAVPKSLENAGRSDTGVGTAASMSRAEGELLRRLPDCLRLLASLTLEDQQLIGQLLQTIISGQIFDLTWFPATEGHDVVTLASDNELDRYTYMVAGCVGEFWTKICRAHLKELERWNIRVMKELGVRFGKGLQLVNVLRDVSKDLRIGRCYLPVNDPRALLDPANYDSIRSEYTKWLDRAVEHLDAGWQYTMKIPPSLWRLRLACIWPIWIGLKTIARLRTANPLDPQERVKVSRSEVYAVMLRSFVVVRNDAKLYALFQKLHDAASCR